MLRPMDSLADGHPYPDGSHGLDRHGLLLAATPILRGQLLHLQSTLAHQTGNPALLLKPLGAALRTNGIQRTLVSAIHRTEHLQIMESYVDNPFQRAILISPTAKNTGAHLQQRNSEVYEAGDRLFQVSMARRLMLAHPAAALATNISPTCPNVNAAKRVCTCPIDPHQLHCIVCKSGGGVVQRHSALARCLADLITTLTGVKVHFEPTISSLPREPHPGAQPEGARMDIVFNLYGQTYFFDTAVVTPFSANAGLIATASILPGYMAKLQEKKKFDRYLRISLAPFILESTGRPGYHARKFIKYLFSDTDHPPPPPPQQLSEMRWLQPNHTPHLHLQTTTQGGHHVTALATVSPPVTAPSRLLALSPFTN